MIRKSRPIGGEQLEIGVPVHMLPPISKQVRGRRLHDIITKKDGLFIRCRDGREIDVQWGDNEAELRGFRDGVHTREVTMPQQFRYLRGKKMDCVYSHGGLFRICMTDGHVIRFAFNSQAADPSPQGIDVHQQLPTPQAESIILGILGLTA